MIKIEIFDLLKIAHEAKKLEEIDRILPCLKSAYHSKLDEWKSIFDKSYVARDSEAWDAMMEYASVEKESYEKAKKDRRNIIGRLKTASKKVQL